MLFSKYANHIPLPTYTITVIMAALSLVVLDPTKAGVVILQRCTDTRF